MYFAIKFSEMGLSKLDIFVIITTIFVFPTLFVVASKNLDAKGVFEWMMVKPKDWIGKK